MKKSLAYGVCAAIAVPAAVHAYRWIKKNIDDCMARKLVGDFIKERFLTERINELEEI